MSSPYSFVDRLLHNLAFSRMGLQDMLTDVEERLFAGQWAGARAERPIFITSLPRAGTTIVLEALHQLPGLATHTYRDMPFVLSPVLWARLAGRFHRQGARSERAHGDGLAINADSPEAFEEVLWRKYYPHKYSGERIALWQPEDADPEFTRFFRDHMKKIVALRQPRHLEDGRYVSKNNGNIARVGLLRRICPDAGIIVPLRHPVEHAVSLWLQHGNFTGQHAADPFVKKYMADIGHYEFGALHRPVDFPGLDELCAGVGPDSVDYWLAYWISAFQHLSAQQGIDFLSYEALCRSAVPGVGQLCEQLGIKAGAAEIAAAAAVFREPSAPRKGDVQPGAGLALRAMELYASLERRCLNRAG